MKRFRKIPNYTAAFFSFLLLPFFSACRAAPDYSLYVSEYRGDIFLAETEDFSLVAFFSLREYPYVADGVCAEKQELAEIYLTVPDNTATYEISFSTGGKDYGGEMSYDNVYARFSYSQSVAMPQERTISFTVTHNGESVTLEAKSGKSGNELTMPELIDKLTERKTAYFEACTKGGVFYGEIYIRLVYEEKCYYFIRVTEENGNSAYFLLDGVSGELLAEKTNDR